ncbi:MAG: DegT/DnrJ/EryC1/StrS family aminotransferase [Candidatus Kapabacteria bacterium]|nr:DegT/DnrJ/EryC1/StrS family aminotransferase [Candidatus Kapabacteria bacterium]MDW8011602.1 DegT/DnrJ/EryC1/StrS family aminotransferase [Bacteroidota bacterium]
MPDWKVERCNLRRQTVALLPELLRVAEEVLRSGVYILGPQLEAFEHEFAQFLGVCYAVGVASGTEALALALAAVGVKAGDEVVTTPFTAIPTIAAIVMVGARPVFVDIDPETYTLNPELLPRALSPRTRAILPVHLFGHCAEMNAILEIAHSAGLPVIEDAAQAHGSRYYGRLAGTMGTMGCFSFYPTKNIGGYGDAGAVVTNDEELAMKLRLLRNYGQTSPYRSILPGYNSRLDELQAAFLRIKLRHVERWNQQRAELAALYRQLLDIPEVQHPIVRSGHTPNWHQYVIRAKRRDALWDYLTSQGIQANVYYPLPAHLQKAYAYLGYREGDFPEAELAAQSVLALPMFPEMTPEEVELVVATIRSFYGHT